MVSLKALSYTLYYIFENKIDTVLRTGSAEDRLRCPEQFEVLNFANVLLILPMYTIRPCPETLSFGRAVPKTGPVARNSLKS